MKNPLKITDLTLRDGHQSLLATRMSTADMEVLAPMMNQVGFYSMEVWGGATFDVAIRFLNEDPWQRLRKLKQLLPDTKLQMLIRGQNLVGYRHYADDVVMAFVRQAADAGIDIFRVFDSVNDERNFESCVAAIKECGKHAQLTLSYSLTERKLGGSVYNIDYYVNKAVIFEKMGADSLCIKDMAGLLAPDDSYNLVSALKKELKIPVHLHCHYTSGMASMSYYKAIEAGVDGVDTDLAPFSLRSAHPAIETFTAAMSGTERDTGLDLSFLAKLDQELEEIAKKYKPLLNNNLMAPIDTGVLIHQIPGGMISNLRKQMKDMGVMNRIDEVFAEIPRVRKDMGYPPLVTPTSQIIGVQAVQNVLVGRYKLVSRQLQDYVYGLYGRPPMPIDQEVQQQVLKYYSKGHEPITCRPADLLPPELEDAEEATQGIAQDICDILTYALYPNTGLPFLKRKYGLEPWGLNEQAA